MAKLINLPGSDPGRHSMIMGSCIPLGTAERVNFYGVCFF